MALAGDIGGTKGAAGLGTAGGGPARARRACPGGPARRWRGSSRTGPRRCPRRRLGRRAGSVVASPRPEATVARVRMALAVDIGGTKVAAGLVTASGELVERA